MHLSLIKKLQLLQKSFCKNDLKDAESYGKTYMNKRLTI